MSAELKRLTGLVRTHRCLRDEAPPELLSKIEAEKRKNEPPQELVDALAHLRRAWAKAAVSQKRNKHIFFLGEVFKVVSEARRLKRQGEFTAGLIKFFDVDPTRRDIFQMLLIVVCGGDTQIDRKTRHRWAACLRTVDRFKTPSHLGAAQILRLGGINRCARR